MGKIIEAEKPKIIDPKQVLADIIEQPMVVPGEIGQGVFVKDNTWWYDECRGPKATRYECTGNGLGCDDPWDEPFGILGYPVNRIDRHDSYIILPFCPELPYRTYMYITLGFHHGMPDYDDRDAWMFVDWRGMWGFRIIPGQCLYVTRRTLLDAFEIANTEIHWRELDTFTMGGMAFIWREGDLRWYWLPIGIQLYLRR